MAKKSQKQNSSTTTIETGVSSELEGALKLAMASASRVGYPTLMDSMLDTADKIRELAEKSKAIKDKTTIKDHYGNSLSAVGTDDKVQSFTNYGYSADTLNWPLWLALYNDSWVFRRAIDKPAQDEVSAGFTLHGDIDYTRVYKLYNRYKNDLTDLLTWGALFGGSIAVMMFEGVGDKELAQPLKKDKIKGKRFKLYVVDRWYGVSPSVDDLVSNMKDIDYGKPRYYEVTMANGTTKKVHHSWVLRYEHRTAPRLIKNGQLQGWGYSEGSHIINELARDDQLKTSITSLVNKSLIEVVHMAGMRGVFMGTDKGNETQLRKRLEMVNWGRTYNSLTFLDKDDQYEHFELTGLSGLAELLEKNMWLISSALEMQGILFGDLKGGLSQESDAFARYAKTIKRRSDAYYRPVLYKFLKIIFIVEGISESPDFDFDSLDKFEDNKKKVESIKQMADMLSKIEEDGIISKFQYAKTLKNFINDDVINLEFSDELLNKLKLEEEQAILDTIAELGKKRGINPNHNPGGQIDLMNPFGGSKQSASSGFESPVESEEEIETENEVESSSEVSEPAEEQPIDEGEKINGESTGQQGA